MRKYWSHLDATRAQDDRGPVRSVFLRHRIGEGKMGVPRVKEGEAEGWIRLEFMESGLSGQGLTNDSKTSGLEP